MKRMFLILVTVALSVCLFACGRPDDKAETPTETPKEETNMNENEPTKQAELTVTEAPTDTPTPEREPIRFFGLRSIRRIRSIRLYICFTESSGMRIPSQATQSCRFLSAT